MGIVGYQIQLYKPRSILIFYLFLPLIHFFLSMYLYLDPPLQPRPALQCRAPRACWGRVRRFPLWTTLLWFNKVNSVSSAVKLTVLLNSSRFFVSYDNLINNQEFQEFIINIINLFAYLYVSFSLPNGWTKLADIFLGNPWVRKFNFLLFYGQRQSFQIVFNET